MQYSLMKDYDKLSYDERYKLATHYYQQDLDPKQALLGYVDDYGGFVSVLISVHVGKAKREFKKYDRFKMYGKTKGEIK